MLPVRLHISFLSRMSKSVRSRPLRCAVCCKVVTSAFGLLFESLITISLQSAVCLFLSFSLLFSVIFRIDISGCPPPFFFPPGVSRQTVVVIRPLCIPAMCRREGSAFVLEMAMRTGVFVSNSICETEWQIQPSCCWGTHSPPY